MQESIVYKRISDYLLGELRYAEHSIVICTPFFKHVEILKTLIIRVKNGCKVRLIISDRPENESAFRQIQKLTVGKPELVIIPLNESWLLEHPFCLINEKDLYLGSYLWHMEIKNPPEYLVVQNEAKESLKPFKIEIERLSKHGVGLKKAFFEEDVKVPSSANGLQMYSNYQLSNLELQLSYMEQECRVFEIEKIELNKVLVDFNHRHTLELGDIIMAILDLRAEKLEEDSAEKKEAEEDKESYQDNYETEKRKDILILDAEDKQELRKLFREATVLCHPDKFSNATAEIQYQAEEIFKSLNLAHAANQLDRVREIWKSLKHGVLKKVDLNEYNTVAYYQQKTEQMRAKHEALVTEVFGLKNSETYRTITEIESWDSYFSQMKETLQKELEELEAM